MTTTSKRRFLVLLTNNYPFGQGEYFLENEIPVIAPYFEKVLIIANSQDGTQTRELPANCLSYNFPITKKKFLRLKLILNHCFSIAGIFLNESPLLFSINPKIFLQRLQSLMTIILWGEEKLDKIGKVINEFRPSETTVYSYWMDHNGYVASRLKRFNRNYRTICRAHGCDLYTERNSANYLPLRPYIINHLDQTVFISQHGYNYLKNRQPTLKNGIVSRLGTKRHDDAICTPSTDQVKRLLSVSNLIPLKQVHLIIEALSLCQSKWQWTHFGNGPERHNLEQLAIEKNINYRFMGAVDNQTILNFYQNCPVDCFINSSSTEGLPVSIMEAISFGVPVIAPAINGIPEIVSEKVGLLLSPTPSAQEIANALDRMAALDLAHTNALRTQARIFWEHNYNADVVFKNLITTLQPE